MFGKVNVKGGLTGGWPHFVKPTTFANGGVHPSRQGQAASRSPMANLDPFALSKAGVEPDIPHNSIDHSLRGKPQKCLGSFCIIAIFKYVDHLCNQSESRF